MHSIMSNETLKFLAIKFLGCNFEEHENNKTRSQGHFYDNIYEILKNKLE